jgi:hypothetical protein
MASSPVAAVNRTLFLTDRLLPDISPLRTDSTTIAYVSADVFGRHLPGGQPDAVRWGPIVYLGSRADVRPA